MFFDYRRDRSSVFSANIIELFLLDRRFHSCLAFDLLLFFYELFFTLVRSIFDMFLDSIESMI